MSEQWAVFRSGYQVSDLGRVRRNGRVLRPVRSSNGYRIFGLHFAGERKNILVHRAVAECFIGPCPEGMQVNHKDGDKLNNAATNLEYVTVSGNQIHALQHGLATVPTARASGDQHWTRTQPGRVARGDQNGARLHPERIVRGSDAHASKVTELIVREIRSLHSDGASQLEIAERFSISRRNVNYIVNGKSWRHVE